MFTQHRLFESTSANSDVYTRNGLLLGKYKGYVIDRADKYGVGRVKVHIPELMIDLKPSKDGIWALPRPFSKSQKMSPMKNEWIQIEFDNGDPNKAYYSSTIKHLDDAPWEMNPKQGVPEKDKANEKVYKDFAASGFKNATLIPPHRDAAANAHVTCKTPLRAHYNVMQDDKDLNFTEARSGDKQVKVQNDKEKYTYMRTKKEYEMMMHEKDKYIELNTPNKFGLRFDDKNKYVKLASKNKNFLIIDDNNDTVMMGTKEMGTQFIKHKEEKIQSDKSNVKAKYDVWHKKRKVSDDKKNKFSKVYSGLDPSAGLNGNNVSCVSSQKIVRINSFGAMSIHDGNTGRILFNPHQG